MKIPRFQTALLGLVVCAASLGGCASRQPPNISQSNIAKARAVADRLQREDAAASAKRRSELGHLMSVRVVRLTENERSLVMVLDVRNAARKTVRRFDIALDVRSNDGKILGTTEIHILQSLTPLARATISRTFPYTQFGEDTGNVVAARGTAVRSGARVKEIRYADGSRAGYDD